MSRKNKKGEKKTGKAAKALQSVSQADITAQQVADADGAPLDQVTYLEAKLILKPDRFTSVQAFRDFGKLVQKTAKASGVGF